MKEIKILITATVCLIAIFSSFMWVYSKTLQRSADDIEKIQSNSAEKYYLQAGGTWHGVMDGNWCEKK